MQEFKNEIYHYFTRIIESPFWKGAFSIMATILVTIFGEFDDIAKYFLIAFAFDFITGVYKTLAVDKKSVKSRCMRKAAPKAISYGIAIMVAHLVDQFICQFGISGFRGIVISMLGITEITSIIENLRETPFKLPAFVQEEFEKYKDKIKKYKK